MTNLYKKVMVRPEPDTLPPTKLPSPCYYPNYEEDGGLIVGEHVFDKKGICCICGEEKPITKANSEKHPCSICGAKTWCKHLTPPEFWDHW